MINNDTGIYQVLLVEDDPGVAEIVKEYLRVSGPYMLEWASSISSLWSHLEGKTYDILLLDNGLPDGTGIEAMEAVRHRGFDLPMIMITGKGDERLAVRAMQLGAVDYLVKGTEFLHLLPTLIQKSIDSYRLQKSARKSLDQVRYQALLLNNVRDAVVVWDVDGNITYWNPAAQKLFGWSSKERLGMPVDEYYLNLFSPPVQPPPREGTSGHEVERMAKTQSGGTLWVSSRVSALYDPNMPGGFLGYMDVSRDISERKQSEQALREAARLAAIGELASSVAHHINNPLTTIIADAQILLHSLPAGHSERVSAEAIEQAGWRVQQAVQQLIEFSEPITGTVEYLCINETIQRAVGLVGDYIASSGVSLEIDLCADLPPVRGNTRQFCDLWVNLLLLARKATADGRPHAIRVRSVYNPGRNILVEVSDDGSPLQTGSAVAGHSPGVFNTVTGRGTGLELNICQEIARQHHSRLVAESHPEQGNLVRVYFPVEVQ